MSNSRTNTPRRQSPSVERSVVPWIFQRLLDRFGPQGWWPVTPPGKNRPVYSAAFSRGRPAPAQAFEVAVGAILTQNTAWTNVEKALEGLNREGLLSPPRLLKTRSSTLQGLIRSSGYFRQKTGRLKGFSRYLLRRWEGRMDLFLNRPTAEVRRELLTLNGIGPETADSILLYAGGHPVFVVDAYTRRFGHRFGLFRDTDYHFVQEQFMRQMPPAVYEYRECHALLVELSKRHCRAKPVCSGCPVLGKCAEGRKVSQNDVR
ncbi:MAG: endonuclease III domain-containing protein [Elusimicrobia bacterium]|nr:endonuclease III domain-containing protein [Elusimicrobiota bacterium]